ncbi:MAG: NADH-quinone oxidoreductase subunit J, partial [Microthrixaceae bacterium]
VIGLAVLALPLHAIASTGGQATGARPTTGAVAPEGSTTPVDPGGIDPDTPNIDQLGESLFTDYLFAFEVTSVLLVIAVVGAVVLSRKVKRADLVDDPLVAEAAARTEQPDVEVES